MAIPANGNLLPRGKKHRSPVSNTCVDWSNHLLKPFNKNFRTTFHMFRVWWMTFWITLWKKLSLYHVHWEKSMRSTDMTMAMAGSMSDFGNAHKYSHTSARITAPCAQLAKVNTTSGKRWPTLTRENPPTPPKKNSPKIIRFRIPPNLVPEILGDWKWFHTPSPFFINWVGLLEVFFPDPKVGEINFLGKTTCVNLFFLGYAPEVLHNTLKNGGWKTTFLFGT